MRVISALGSLALCIAIFLFFYRIWGLMTTPVQVAVLVAVPLVALAATEFAAERAFALILAYRFRLRLLLTGGLMSLLAFLSASIMSGRGYNWLSFGDRPENFIPAGVILLVLPATEPGKPVPEFASTYRAIGMLALFIPVYFWVKPGTLRICHSTPRWSSTFISSSRSPWRRLLSGMASRASIVTC